MNILKSRKCVYLFIFKKRLLLVSGSFLQFASADTAASLPLSAFGLQMWPDVLSDRDDSMRGGGGDGAGTDRGRRRSLSPSLDGGAPPPGDGVPEGPKEGPDPRSRAKSPEITGELECPLHLVNLHWRE